MYLQLLVLLSLAVDVYGGRCIDGRSTKRGNGYWQRFGHICYGFFDKIKMTHQEAKLFCCQKCGSLAMPKTLSVNEFLAKTLKHQLRDGEEYLIGIDEDLNIARHSDHWNWADGTEYHPFFDFDEFKPGQGPNGSMYQRYAEECVTMDLTGKWQSAYCGHEEGSPYRYHFICQKDGFVVGK